MTSILIPLVGRQDSFATTHQEGSIDPQQNAMDAQD